MMEVYILEKRYEDDSRYEHSNIVGVYTTLELAIKESGGHDWNYTNQDDFDYCAYSRGAYTADDPECTVYRFIVKS